jgi:phage terminase large subunit-like protein
MLPHDNCSLIESLAFLSETEQAEALAGFTEDEIRSLIWDWRANARKNQIQPAGDWRFWLLLAGRGFGKTKTGAETVREWASQPLEAPIHLVAPTASDIRGVMIEGPSGILSCYPHGSGPVYEPSRRHRLTWPNGNVALGFSADEPERLRGPQCGRFWADELAAWRYLDAAWDNLMFGFRVGSDLRGVITTTPKPLEQLRKMIADKGTIVTRGSTYDNRSNLNPEFLSHVITKYEGTRLGRQELNAELLDDVPGALWTRKLIDAGRVHHTEVDKRPDVIIRIVVAVDPAVTSGEESDETGIIAAALTRSLHVLVLDDASCKETPLGWAKAATGLLGARRGDRIVGEVNNGGDLVEANLRAVDANVPYRKVWASRGKAVRAEPVAALYEQGRVHHVMRDGTHGTDFDKLEDEMCSYVPGVTGKSPNRMDALVWAITDLLIDPAPQTVTVPVGVGPGYQISPI